MNDTTLGHVDGFKDLTRSEIACAIIVGVTIGIWITIIGTVYVCHRVSQEIPPSYSRCLGPEAKRHPNVGICSSKRARKANEVGTTKCIKAEELTK
jgi:hypothetical protein